MNLLNYNEFQEIADFIDKTSESKFNKFLKMSEETYLSDLIGREFVAKLKEEEYSELMELVKKCLALNIEMLFLETAKITIIGEGGVSRTSDYSKRPEFIDKKNSQNALAKLLRAYETSLIREISEGDYPEWNEATEVSKKVEFNITAIG